jgi:hypothetical protein
MEMCYVCICDPHGTGQLELPVNNNWESGPFWHVEIHVLDAWGRRNQYRQHGAARYPRAGTTECCAPTYPDSLHRARPIRIVKLQSRRIKTRTLCQQSFNGSGKVVHLNFGRAGQLGLSICSDKCVPQICAAALQPQTGRETTGRPRSIRRFHLRAFTANSRRPTHQSDFRTAAVQMPARISGTLR